MTDFAILAIACSIVYLVFTIIILYQIFKIKELRQIIEGLKEKSAVNSSKSQELTDFLRDIDSHGFSFTRVDPDSVLMRSPRK